MSLHLPAVTPDEIAAFRSALAAAGPLSGEEHAEYFAVAVALTETLLDSPADGASLALLVDLARNAERAFVPEHFALQSAFGPRVGARMIDDLLRLADRAARRGLTPDAYVELLRTQDRIPDALAARLLRGQARRRPDRARIARAGAVLARLVALLPAHRQTGPLCAWGWLRWADGDAVSAAAAMRLALRREPGYPLAVGLLVLIERGAPVWVPTTAGGATEEPRRSGADQGRCRR
jgi:hypothetical protein